MLQVPEKFRLLAFCTRARHVFQLVRRQRFAFVTRIDSGRYARRLCYTLLSLALLASSCVKMPRRTPDAAAPQATLARASDQSQTFSRININTASLAELEKLPGIGAGLAARIIAHRGQFGRFRRAEHLIIVRGISERRFRAMRDFITVD